MDVPKTRYARTGDGTHIAYQVWGSGPVDILMSTALWWHVEFQWTWPTMARFFERMGRLGRVIMFDKRGTGLSDRVALDRLPTLEQRMDDLTAVLDAAESESAVLYGQMHGSPLAILFAATKPDRSSALVLVDAFARFMRAPDYPWGFPPELSARVVEQMEEHWDEPQALRQLTPSIADDPEWREWWMTMQRLAVSPGAAVALWNMNLVTDVRDVLPAVHLPTLVVTMRDGRLVDPGCGRHLAEHIAGAQYFEVPGESNFDSSSGAAEVIERFLTGESSGAAPDRVLATVLFTDIVDSTSRLATLGDRRWRELLDQHDDLVERALTRHRGHKVNPTGDGMVATFDGPARAVECAQAIVAGAVGLGLDVRAGVHTGEIELRGDDIGGIAVHLCARVAALAQARQVLVTRTVTDLVAGSNLVFESRGEHELKGVPGAWALFAVRPS